MAKKDRFGEMMKSFVSDLDDIWHVNTLGWEKVQNPGAGSSGQRDLKNHSFKVFIGLRAIWLFWQVKIDIVQHIPVLCIFNTYRGLS